MPTQANSTVYNHDIRGLHTRLNRFLTEMMLAASSNLANVSSFDQERLMAYLAAVRTYHDWIMAQPHLDLPETAPKQYELDPNPDPPVLENEAIRDILVLFELCRDELVNSQSARMPCGLLPFDSARFSKVVDKIEAFLTTYIATVQPLDLPESSPQRSMAPAGKTGV